MWPVHYDYEAEKHEITSLTRWQDKSHSSSPNEKSSPAWKRKIDLYPGRPQKNYDNKWSRFTPLEARSGSGVAFCCIIVSNSHE